MSASVHTFVVPDLKDVLFATDFSPCSEAVIPVLRSLALCCGATVHVVHAVSPLVMTSMPLEMAPEFDPEYRDAENALQSLHASGALTEVTCTSIVARGDAAEVINQVAEAKHASLIVLGTHGRRGLNKLVLGSTAEQVIRTAPCPVLTVGPEASRRGQAPAALGPIIFATNLEARPHPALRFAVLLARANHLPIILLHAVPPDLIASEPNLDSVPFTPAFSAEFAARAVSSSRRQMEKIISDEQLQDLKPQIVVESRPAGDLIVRTAEESHAAMIVMGAHSTGMPSAAAHFPGATASAVLCAAPCPVTTVRD